LGEASDVNLSIRSVGSASQINAHSSIVLERPLHAKRDGCKTKGLVEPGVVVEKVASGGLHVAVRCVLACKVGANFEQVFAPLIISSFKGNWNIRQRVQIYCSLREVQ
jgi:hypothetical protein